MLFKNLIDYFEEMRESVLNKCIKCGLCYKNCSLNELILKEVSPKEAQEKVLTFLKEGTEDKIVYERAFSCLQCFKCVNKCPKGIDPLLINEIIKWDYRKKGSKIMQYSKPINRESPQRIISSIQVTKEDYQRITSQQEKKKVKYIFFPGCNVYYQPEKILSALDILEFITEDFAFLPGLDYCCGNEHLFYGDVEQAQKAMNKLVTELISYEPESVILWCPTCLCRFNTTIAKLFDLPFQIVSYPQFLADNIDKLEIKSPIKKVITLHEPCKSAFTKLDENGTRELLKNIPGLKLVEMKRHGENTVCCGLGALGYSNEIVEFMRDDRLKEADETNTDILVDVCHACHMFFSKMEHKYSYEITNYITLLARALGIERKDKFKEYIKMNDLKSILDDEETYIDELPFSKEKIEKTIHDIILK